MPRKTFIGTCSQCRERAGVIRKRGVQLCGVCITKLETTGNIRAFRGKESKHA